MYKHAISVSLFQLMLSRNYSTPKVEDNPRTFHYSPFDFFYGAVPKEFD